MHHLLHHVFVTNKYAKASRTGTDAVSLLPTCQNRCLQGLHASETGPKYTRPAEPALRLSAPRQRANIRLYPVPPLDHGASFKDKNNELDDLGVRQITSKHRRARSLK